MHPLNPGTTIDIDPQHSKNKELPLPFQQGNPNSIHFCIQSSNSSHAQDCKCSAKMQTTSLPQLLIFHSENALPLQQKDAGSHPQMLNHRSLKFKPANNQKLDHNRFRITSTGKSRPANTPSINTC